MPEREWSSKHLNINDKSGGALLAEGVDGTTVTATRYGDMAWRYGINGELMANFSAAGIGCVYSANGELEMAAFDVNEFVRSTPMENVTKMVNQGEDLMTIAKGLKSRGEVLIVAFFPKIGGIRVTLMGKNGVISENKDLDLDFTVGIGGDITVNETPLIYHVFSQSDEMRLALGEINGDKRSLLTVSVAHFVNFQKYLKNRDPKKYWNLAERIILNR